MKLVLFFSRGISFSIWHDSGLLDREIATYKRMLTDIGQVLFVTYGKKSEDTFIRNQKNFQTLYNHWGFPIDLFGILCPLLFRSKVHDSDIYKTNQINGWWAGGIAKLLYGKPLVVRCGYLLSLDQERKRYGKFRRHLVSVLERCAFNYADATIVTTRQIKKEVIRRYNIPSRKINVIPNPVDISIFRPIPEIMKVCGRVCFVGRLSPEKNLELLLEALSGVENVSILVIGDGELKESLKSLATLKGVDACFYGNIPNNELPALLNTCEAFVLPSKWEGMPKALIEAMACGISVIGTDVPGIRTLIKHGRTGLLCKAEIESLHNAVKTILGNSQLSEEMGRRARDYVVKNFSLEHCVSKELDLLISLAKK